MINLSTVINFTLFLLIGKFILLIFKILLLYIWFYSLYISFIVLAFCYWFLETLSFLISLEILMITFSEAFSFPFWVISTLSEFFFHSPSLICTVLFALCVRDSPCTFDSLWLYISDWELEPIIWKLWTHRCSCQFWASLWATLWNSC